MALNRAPFTSLVDDDGSGTTGTPWNKQAIKDVILDPVDAAAAFVNAPNTFTAQPQTISVALGPALAFNETGQPANARRWLLSEYNGAFYLQSTNDAGALQTSALTVDRAGSVTIGNNLTATGAGGNVACKNQQNTFTIHQQVACASPNIYSSNTAAGANAKLFSFLNTGGSMYLQALDDAAGYLLNTLSISRAGDLTVARDITEKGRPTPMGHATFANLSSYLASFSGPYNYTLIGKTILLTISATGTAAGQGALVIALPAGLVPASSVTLPATVYWAGPGWQPGVCILTTGASTFALYPSAAAFPSAAVNFSINIHFQIQ